MRYCRMIAFDRALEYPCAPAKSRSGASHVSEEVALIGTRDRTQHKIKGRTITVRCTGDRCRLRHDEF